MFQCNRRCLSIKTDLRIHCFMASQSFIIEYNTIHRSLESLYKGLCLDPLKVVHRNLHEAMVKLLNAYAIAILHVLNL